MIAIIHSRTNYHAGSNNNEIGSSIVDANIEDSTGWFGWQPRIGEVTNRILS